MYMIEELKDELPSPEVMFQYGEALCQSYLPDDIRQGICLLEGNPHHYSTLY